MLAPHFQILSEGQPGGGLFSTLTVMEFSRDFSRPILVTQADSHASALARERGFEVAEFDFDVSRFQRALPLKLLDYARERQPSFFFVHGGIALHFMNRAIRALHDIPTVYSPHGYRFPVRNLAVRFFKARLERFLSQKVDFAVFVADYERIVADEWRLFRPDARTEVIYNAVDPSEIPQARDPKPRTVALLGRCVQQKNPFFVVDIARILAEEGFHFTIVGGGEMEAAIRRKIDRLGLNDHVHITGELPRRAALDAMTEVETAILPSFWEGLPRVIPELMIMGVPVVAAAVSGVPEVVEDEVTGVTIKGYNAADYAAAIRRLSSDREWRSSMIQNAREFVLEAFSRRRARERYEAIFRLVSERVRAHQAA